MTPEEKFNKGILLILEKQDFDELLYLLKTFYVKILEILDISTKYGFFIKNTVINHYYVVLLSFVKGILQGKDFEKLSKESPELFESLIGDIEEMDIVWELLSKKAYDFLGKIEKQHILSACPEFELPKELKTFLENTDKAIISHKEYCEKISEEMFKNTEEETEKEPNDKSLSDKETRSPIPVTIVGDVSIKGFEEKVILQKPKNKKIQLRKFPADAKWENITIQFLNGQEVIIKVKNLTFQTTYEEMGFQDEKRKLPNKQWEFLKGLSEIDGELSWKSQRATSKGKKQKQLLAETLKAYFQIDEDPFYAYREEKSYKIRISLIPETKSTPNTKEDCLGIEEYRKEQSPEVYEE